MPPVSTTTTTIEIHKGPDVFSCTPGNRRPFKSDYYAVGPDGVEYQNNSIVTLRSLLRQRYGRVTLVETWKTPR